MIIHSVDELYHTNGILKIKEYIDLLNCLFVKNVISNESLPLLSKYFERSYNLHNHTTRQATHNSVKICHRIPSLTGTIQSEINQLLHGILL